MQNVKVSISILNIFMQFCISCVCIEHIFVIRYDVRNLLDISEISPKSDIRLRHLTFPRYLTFKTLVVIHHLFPHLQSPSAHSISLTLSLPYSGVCIIIHFLIRTTPSDFLVLLTSPFVFYSLSLFFLSLSILPLISLTLFIFYDYSFCLDYFKMQSPFSH